MKKMRKMTSNFTFTWTIVNVIGEGRRMEETRKSWRERKSTATPSNGESVLSFWVIKGPLFARKSTYKLYFHLESNGGPLL